MVKSKDDVEKPKEECRTIKCFVGTTGWRVIFSKEAEIKRVGI